jgi:2-polyprenyl-6-methoxyphenol hydroxylase-like FAD-dependent oxidoreductase
MPEGALRLGAPCTGFTADDQRVTVRLADGSEQSGDILVGADGLHSVIRAGLGLTEPGFPPYAGYTLWHSVIPFDLEKAGVPASTFLLTFGRGSRFACYRIDENRVYWSGIGYVAEGGRDGAGGRKRDVLERFHGWHAPIEALIDATADNAIHRVDIFGGQMLQRWGQGRVTMLGDAAHPMTTNFGQGAGMAIEDAVALAEALGRGGDLQAALRGYEELRRVRVTAMMNLANKLNSTASLESPFRCWMRDTMIRYLFRVGIGRQYEREMTRPL